MIIPDIVTNFVTISADNATPTNATLTNHITLLAGVTLSISKSITGLTLDSIGISTPVPGATMTYNIKYSNQGPGSANNMIIRDALPSDVEFWTNGATGTWQIQYATAASPDQAWSSTVYSNSQPAVSSNVKWVRWINAAVPAGASGSFTYSVIIK